jgi:hypothetical protein
LFKRVEAGEILRVVRGNREVAVIQPADVVADDEAFLSALADFAVKQMGEAFPPNEFADWGKNNGAG